MLLQSPVPPLSKVWRWRVVNQSSHQRSTTSPTHQGFVMDVASIAAAASANAMAEVQQEAAVSVLKKTLDIQQQSAMQLLQAIPQAPAPSVGTAGGYIDTWA
jgi:hypothetical protein